MYDASLEGFFSIVVFTMSIFQISIVFPIVSVELLSTGKVEIVSVSSPLRLGTL